MSKPRLLALTQSGLYPEPGSSEGPNVNGPTSSTTGHLAQFADANGGELSDSGVPATSVSQGPASAIAGNLPAFLDTTGKALQDSGLTTAGLAEIVHERIVGASTAAAGSTTTDATVLPDATGGIYPTTLANGTKGVRIHVDDKVLNRQLYIANGAAAVLKIYPPTGGTINGAAADAAFSTPSGIGAWLVCSNATTNAWLAFV